MPPKCHKSILRSNVPGEKKKTNLTQKYSFTFNQEEVIMETQIKYLNEKQVSEMTGRALSTLRNERFLGKGMPYIKIGKSIRYKLGDIITFMEAGRIETQ